MAVPYDFYDYRAYWQGREYENESEQIALRKFFQKIGNLNSVADLGGGYGRLVPLLRGFSKKVILLEPSLKNLCEAKKILKNFSGIDYVRGGFPKLPFKDGEVESAVMVRVMHHLADPEPAIIEVARVLKPGGFFILEFANKIHFLARIKAILRRDYKFINNLEPVERRTLQSIRENKIIFLNHHPKKILEVLRNNDFEVISLLSVSNFRHPIIKKIIPIKFLLFCEDKWQNLLVKFFFGPSIFILARKPIRLDMR